MSFSSEWVCPTPTERAMIEALIRYQYGVEPGKILPRGYKVSRSRKTGRIRYIGINGAHLATIRATDGLLVPGELLAETIAKETEYKVAIEAEAAKFVGEGRTVFSKHVVKAGSVIRPGDEIVVIDERGVPVALGKAVLPGPDMVVMKRGKAVKTRRGLLSGKNDKK